jgi:serine protease Do
MAHEEGNVRDWMHRGLVGAGLVAGIVAAGTAFEVVREGRALEPAADYVEAAAQAASPPAQAAAPALADPRSLSRAFRSVAAAALPGVVYIQVQAGPAVAGDQQEPRNPLEEFFRRGTPDARPRTGSGSGFIIRPDGYIVTNNHVVQNAQRVTVVLQDRRELSARVVGRDPNTDIAVVKVEAAGLPVVEAGNSDGVEVGDWVVALGYPLELGVTATAGIVSAKGRSLNILRRSREAAAPIEHFIQTDAAINPGNSGGPLVDLDGRAVGVNTAIATQTGYYSGYGFAVPINLAMRIADDLIRYGETRRPRLGAMIGDVDPAAAEVHGLARAAGVHVVGVEDGSPAAAGGLRIGDVITALDGRSVETAGDMLELLALRRPTEEVRLSVARYGRNLTVSVRLGAFEPAVPAVPVAEQPRSDANVGRLGFAATDANPQLASRHRLPQNTTGPIITNVPAGGAAERAGLQVGMVVEQVNGRAVQRLRELETAAQALGPGRALSLVVRRPDGSRTVVSYRIPE